MALITKIREKSGIAAAAIAISLVLFLVGGDIFSGNSKFFGGNSQKLGEIAGETIMAQDFQKLVETQAQNYTAQSGRSANDQEMSQIRDQVWNQQILNIAYKREFDALGLAVSPEELTDMVQGNNIDPSVRQQFTNPQTGQFDKQFVIDFLKGFKKMKPEQQKAWVDFEKSIGEGRVRSKYEGLLRLSTYTTNIEAQKEYAAQTAKASVRYLYVPFYSIVDSTVKVTDSDLQKYLDAHKEEFKSENTRSLQYITFPVIPSKNDTASFYTEIKNLAKELAVSKNDSAFAIMNSDVKTPYYVTASELPEAVKGQIGTFNVGGIYGPFKSNNVYSIYKYGGIKKDSVFTARASHILIGAAKAAPDSVKVAARMQAERVLAQIRGGANFEMLAQQYSVDQVSAQRGGDLGPFKSGMMMKPFDNAVFGMKGTGLIPGIVETDYGYHIIKVTEAKTNTAYKLAAINRSIAPSQATIDDVFRKSDAFAASNTTKAAFDASLKKDKSLIMLRADRIVEGATGFSTLRSAREIVRWAFNSDRNIGDVSEVFQIDNQCIIATLTGETDKDKVTIEDFRDQLTAKVRAELKAEQILKKMSGLSGTLEQIAQKYGAGALVETANDITLTSGVLTSAGADPAALGKAFGQKIGQKSKPFKGEAGVFMMETVSATPAPALADLSAYKNTARMTATQNVSFLINQAIKDNAKISDNRARFY